MAVGTGVSLYPILPRSRCTPCTMKLLEVALEMVLSRTTLLARIDSGRLFTVPDDDLESQ